jgi:hypothetical protein
MPQPQVLLNFLRGHGLHLIPTPLLPHLFIALGTLRTQGPFFLICLLELDEMAPLGKYDKLTLAFCNGF